MIKRHTIIEKLLNKKQSVLILGPRGSGKSYYMNHLLTSCNNKLVIDFLEPETFDTFLKSTGQLSKIVRYQLDSTENLIVFIDEVQKFPEVLDEVHLLLEKYSGRIVFALTGSSARKLKRKQVNLLAGRAIYIPFYPFSFEEVDFQKNIDRVLQYGTLPKSFIASDYELIENYLRTYTHIYLKEEIQEESLTRNLGAFSQFLELAAFDNGMPINYSKIARQVGVSVKTIQGHYQILEDTLLVTRIPAWTHSVRKQMVQMPKYYFFDNGVLNSLTGELKTELKESSYRYGKLFENLVINEIIRLNTLKGMDYKLFHYRTNNGAEIDLILQRNIKSPPIAVEIKSSKTPSSKDVKQFKHILEEFPETRCYVICQTQLPYKDSGIQFLPFPEGLNELFSAPK